jgi:hypothetical protein
MIDSVKISKCRPLREVFNNSIPEDAIDLVGKLLVFNP